MMREWRMFVLIKDNYHLLHISRDYRITIFFPFSSNVYHFSSLHEKGLPSCDDRKWLMKIPKS